MEWSEMKWHRMEWNEIKWLWPQDPVQNIGVDKNYTLLSWL